MIHKKLLKRNEYGMKHLYYFLRQNIVQEYSMVSIKTEKIEKQHKKIPERWANVKLKR